MAKKQKKMGKTKMVNQNQMKKGDAKAAETVQVKRPRQKVASGTGLSPCAELYLKALLNPWGEFSELPCVPCTPADMTYRYRTITRGVMGTGTNGVGFVSWGPLNPTNDIQGVFCSTSAYTGTSFGTPGAGVNGIVKSSLPYSSSAFSTAGNHLSARLVGSCMKITNTTNQLKRQGSILACRLTTGELLSSASAAQLAQSLENVKKTLVDGKDEPLVWGWIPQDEEDYDFPDGAYTYANTAGNRSGPNFGFLVTGASSVAGDYSSFDWELVEFWEFAGMTTSITLPNLEKSHADPVGLGRVLESVSVPRQSLRLTDQLKHYSQNAVEMMAHSDSAAKTVEDLLGLAGLSAGTVAGLAKGLFTMLSL